MSSENRSQFLYLILYCAMDLLGVDVLAYTSRQEIRNTGIERLLGISKKRC